MNPSYKKRKPSVPPPKGLQPLRLIAVIALGTQKSSFKGQDKFLDKVLFIWETMKDYHVFSEEKGPQPWTIREFYTNSLDDKANLRKSLERWKGEKLTEEEILGYDLFQLLGKTATGLIIHAKGKGDNSDVVYGNIDTLMSEKPTVVKKPHNPVIGFQFEGPCYINDPKKERPVSQAECLEFMENTPLFKYTVDTIKLSPEYKKLNITSTVQADEEPYPDEEPEY